MTRMTLWSAVDVVVKAALVVYVARFVRNSTRPAPAPGL